MSPHDAATGTTLKKTEELECFRQYCRIFYESSLLGRQNSQDQLDVELAKAVLEAYEWRLLLNEELSKKWTPEQREAMDQCGLVSNDKRGITDVGAYVAVQNEERARAHRSQMWRRTESLQTTLQTFHSKNIHSATFSDAIRHIRQFCQSRAADKHQVGSHSLLAGLISLLNQQLQQLSSQKMVQWTFDGCVLTEQDRVKNDNYMFEALELLHCLLIPKNNDCRRNEGHSLLNNTEEEKSAKDAGAEASITLVTLTWELNPHWSNTALTKFLKELPRLSDLHARPTGTFQIVSVSQGRSNMDGGDDDESSLNDVSCMECMLTRSTCIIQ
uniref:Uncharacterized protein n=1 Tax=Attheya septentrionalis TaxID=420275 RepID=A0A7S2XNP4_9STRA|mmetsp:Transcript_23935/g.43291  ORF Transcript_23935/g.43291 Transcript_23935/m.43291 type:complete len:329 (+) Transcript_23935:356-1342(+)